MRIILVWLVQTGDNPFVCWLTCWIRFLFPCVTYCSCWHRAPESPVTLRAQNDFSVMMSSYWWGNAFCRDFWSTHLKLAGNPQHGPTQSLWLSLQIQLKGWMMLSDILHGNYSWHQKFYSSHSASVNCSTGSAPRFESNNSNPKITCNKQALQVCHNILGSTNM